MNGLFNVTKHINHTKLGLSQNILIFFKLLDLLLCFRSLSSCLTQVSLRPRAHTHGRRFSFKIFW